MREQFIEIDAEIRDIPHKRAQAEMRVREVIDLA